MALRAGSSPGVEESVEPSDAAFDAGQMGGRSKGGVEIANLHIQPRSESAVAGAGENYGADGGVVGEGGEDLGEVVPHTIFGS